MLASQNTSSLHLRSSEFTAAAGPGQRFDDAAEARDDYGHGSGNGNENVNESEDVGFLSASHTASSVGANTPRSIGALVLRARRLLVQGIAHLRAQWKILLAGQVLSFLTASTGATQATLSFDCHLSAPTLTLGLCYMAMSVPALLVLVFSADRETEKTLTLAEAAQETQGGEGRGINRNSFSSFAESQNDDREGLSPSPTTARYRFLGIVPLQAPPMAYLPMAVLDVYANYFTVLAFKYTTITSVTLFDALAIPSAMILSSICLRRRYSRIRLLAVASCIFGILLNVLQDYEEDHPKYDTRQDGAAPVQHHGVSTKTGVAIQDIYPHRTTGDVLAILGGLLFGATNTYGEYAVRHLGGPFEYIGMLSVFGTIICLLQTLLIEREDIALFTKTDSKSECSTSTTQWLIVAFVGSAVATYLGTARFLQVSDAAFFNLSLLTGDLWSVVFSIVEEGIVPGSLFFVALIFIVTGVIVYEMTEAPGDGLQQDHSKIESNLILVAKKSTDSNDDKHSSKEEFEMPLMRSNLFPQTNPDEREQNSKRQEIVALLP